LKRVPAIYLAPFSIMFFRSLVSVTLCLLGTARRSTRIGDARYDAQQQNKTLTEALDVSADARETFLPWRSGTPLRRRPGLQLHNTALPLGVGLPRATVDLHAASGPEGGPGPLPVLCFDLDNTLWDTAATMKAAYEAMVAAAPAIAKACRSPSAFYAEMMAMRATHPDKADDFTFLRRAVLLRLLGTEERATFAFDAWFAARNSPVFFPGAIECLHLLRRQGYRLCAISDGNSEPLKIPELAGIFEFAVNAVEAGAAKPDRRPFLLAAERAGVPCTAMVYVGDNYEKDVLGAQAVGMRAVLVRNPPPTGPATLEVSVADAEITTVADLPEALLAFL